jgi:2-oxo-4-hydroxy-4-carboxy-5-ureidoimidazoline decarboxylase
MSDVLKRWNTMMVDKAAEEILPCCGSKTWARRMAERRPISNDAALLAACDEVCRSLAAADWNEAFLSHSRIGESKAAGQSTSRSQAWSEEEQARVGTTVEDVKLTLAEANHEYEDRFKRIFIVCATGKSATEILDILWRRLHNDEATEFQEAAEEQRKIARLRLKKWLASLGSRPPAGYGAAGR